MIKVILIILTSILTSFYYFPIFTTLLPTGVNTKMLMGVMGIIIVGYRMAIAKNGNINRNILDLSIYAFVFTLIVRFSVVYNDTPDDSYTSYFMSMWVWMGGAYALCNIIRSVHGKLSLTLVANYLIVVCVFQCFAAIIIDNYPTVKTIVNIYVLQEQHFLDKVKRLYGIGANLDTAGIRFSITLILLVYVVSKIKDTDEKFYIWLYFFAWIVIVLIGNMIARTTTVGLILSLLYMMLGIKSKKIEVWKKFGVVLIVAIPILCYYYYANEDFAKKIQFGFEGFISLVETGQWDVGSNNQLMNMIVFPDNLKTWIIGDGYFNNPIDVDPNYLGEITGGYYKNCDIGYLRFIFFCGVLGLVAFSLLLCKATTMCIDRHPQCRTLFLLLLATNFIVWLKVSTDCFLIFALLLFIPNNEYYKVVDSNSEQSQKS